MIFRQVDFRFNNREYIIENDGVRVISKSVIGKTEEFIDFHDIGNKIIRKTKRAVFLLFLSLLFSAHGTLLLVDHYNGGRYVYAAIIYFTMSLIFFLVFYFYGEKHLYLYNKKTKPPIRFLDNNPSEEKLMIFIDHIAKAQRMRLQQLYLKFDENKSYEEYRLDIEWLRDNRYLSLREAEQRLGEIKTTFDQQDDSVSLGS